MATDDALRDPDDEMVIAPMDYTCRVCTAGKTIYVRSEVEGDAVVIDLHRVKLVTHWCDECGEERTMVADEAIGTRTGVKLDG